MYRTRKHDVDTKYLAFYKHCHAFVSVCHTVFSSLKQDMGHYLSFLMSVQEKHKSHHVSSEPLPQGRLIWDLFNCSFILPFFLRVFKHSILNDFIVFLTHWSGNLKDFHLNNCLGWLSLWPTNESIALFVNLPHDKLGLCGHSWKKWC